MHVLQRYITLSIIICSQPKTAILCCPSPQIWCVPILPLFVLATHYCENPEHKHESLLHSSHVQNAPAAGCPHPHDSSTWWTLHSEQVNEWLTEQSKPNLRPHHVQRCQHWKQAAKVRAANLFYAKALITSLWEKRVEKIIFRTCNIRLLHSLILLYFL